jgi:imidazole glycerol-phosphate synthase subunit HisF
MIAKRIIPCLDILGGRTVKGVNFVDLIDAGDPVELATLYSEKGADELVFLDISATEQQRDAFEPLVYAVAKKLSIPFTVGGGIRSTEKVARLLHKGVDKVSINSSAVNDPDLISQIANNYGSQCLIVAIDAKREGDEWWVYTTGGKQRTSLSLLAWAKECQERGAGELLFTSMDHDGTKNGFANEQLAELSETLSIPIIASGGAGTLAHFKDVFLKGKADAALAASVFHFSEIEIATLKQFLAEAQIPVRL